MTPAELTALVQVFLDAYVLGNTQDTRSAFAGGVGLGIRRRFPAVLDIPPEYGPLPNGFDNTVFLNGQGPESFPEPSALYLDLCPLERTIVTPTSFGAHVQFFFVVRYPAGQFEGHPEVVCLPSGDELLSIMSECMNKIQDFFGTDADLVPGNPELSPQLTCGYQVLTFQEFNNLELTPVQP